MLVDVSAQKARLHQIRQLSSLSQSVALPMLSGGGSTSNLAHMPGLYLQLLLECFRFQPGLSQASRIGCCIVSTSVSWQPLDVWSVLGLVSYGLHMQLSETNGLTCVNLNSCLSAQLTHAWTNLAFSPRSCPSEGARTCSYLRLFDRPAHIKQIDLLRQRRNAKVRYFRFRTGCYALPNVAGGWDRGASLSEAICPLGQLLHGVVTATSARDQYSDERQTLLKSLS